MKELDALSDQMNGAASRFLFPGNLHPSNVGAVTEMFPAVSELYRVHSEDEKARNRVSIQRITMASRRYRSVKNWIGIGIQQQLFDSFMNKS
jgi:hypothetical protein